MKKGSARSNLYEICAANHWKRPVFECCKEEGPCHHRMFTFKVIIEIDEASKNIIECYGAPNQKKKMAADHAAEGALCTAKASTATKLFHSSVMLSRLGCHCSEDHAFLGGPLFSVKSLFLFLVGVLLSQWSVLLVVRLFCNTFLPKDTTSRDRTVIFLLFAGLCVSSFIS